MLKYEVVIRKDDDGHSIRYQKNGILHRVNGPAFEVIIGIQQWYLHGSNSSIEWFRDGLRHRLNGPAIKFKGKSMEWWQYGDYYGAVY